MNTTETAFLGKKSGVAQVAQAVPNCPHVRMFEDYLRKAGSAKEMPVPPVPPVSDTEVRMQPIEPHLPGKRWTAVDELACTAKCKRCGQPIIWGQCDSDTAGKDVGRWYPLDPDMGLHGCERSQL